MNDLIKENERLQKELDTLTKKYQKVKLLAQQQGELNKRTTNEVNKMVNTINTLQAQVARIGLLEELNGHLKHENEKLNGSLEILQQKYDVLLAQANNVKPVKLRKEVTDIVSARILSRFIETEDIIRTMEELKEEYGYNIARAKAYRTVTVSESTDYIRIMTLYRTYREEFGEMTEEDVKEWFRVKRIKRLKLMSEPELIVNYGVKLVRAILPKVDADEFVENYYSQEPFIQAKER